MTQDTTTDIEQKITQRLIAHAEEDIRTQLADKLKNGTITLKMCIDPETLLFIGKEKLRALVQQSSPPAPTAPASQAPSTPPADTASEIDELERELHHAQATIQRIRTRLNELSAGAAHAV
jgi:hypothetical protein